MKLKVICLGIGNGTSYILRGIASSSFVVTINEEPFILVDCGVGIGLSYKNYFGDKIPNNIYISHNHTDHTGDLPIMLLDFYKRGNKKINIWGHKEVLDIVKKFRLHEFYATGLNIEEMANWNFQNDANEIIIDKNVKLNLIKSMHSYLCYGFNFLYKDKIIIGYSGDSGFSTEIYNFIAQSDNIIVDGRLNESTEHASFEEIDTYALQNKNKRFYIIHHEIENYKFTSMNVSFLKKYDIIEVK